MILVFKQICNTIILIKIKVCLWNTGYAPSGNKVKKSYYKLQGLSQGHKVIDLGVIWKGVISEIRRQF